MTRSFTASLLGLALVACSPDDGTIAARVYGEELIETEIPPDRFVDQWTVSFNKFLVSLGQFRAQGTDGGSAFKIYDLAQPSDGAGYAIGEFPAPGGTREFSYTIQPAAAATAANASASDVAAFTQNGYSIWITGVATRGADFRMFDFGFTLTADFDHCVASSELDGGTLAVEATIHGDRIFHDDLVGEPDVAFDLIAQADGAAGTPADELITLAELAGTDITGQVRYQVGALKDLAGADIVNLRQFIEHQLTTIGGLDGDGACEGVGAP